MVSLASSMHAGPLTYALLLGSGVSVSSGVASGWAVTLGLIERLAQLHDEDTGDDPKTSEGAPFPSVVRVLRASAD